jgi:hypothetical protein
MISGEFPSDAVREMVKLIKLNIAKNSLTGPKTLNLTLPNLAHLDLSQNSFSKVKIDRWELRESGLLRLEENKFSCPLPKLETNFRIKVGFCENDEPGWLYAYIVVLVFAALVGSVAAYLYFGPKRLRIRMFDEHTKTIKILVYFGYALFSMVDDVLALVFFAEMFQYLNFNAIPVCDAFDAPGVFETPITYFLNDKPYPAPEDYSNFQGYIKKLKELVSTWGDAEIAVYKEDCGLLEGCKYNDNEYKCVRDANYSGTKEIVSFRPFAYAVCAIVLLKEFAKLVVILVCVIKRGGEVPMRLRKMCRTSSFAFLLLFRGWGLFMENIILHEASARDEAFAIFHEGVCENFLRFPLSLVYALNITRTGLHSRGWASVITTSVFIIVMLVKPVIKMCVQYKLYRICKNCSKGKQDLKGATKHAGVDTANVEMTAM